MEKKKPRGIRKSPARPEAGAHGPQPLPGIESQPAPASDRLAEALTAASRHQEDKLSIPPETSAVEAALTPAQVSEPVPESKPQAQFASGSQEGSTIASLLFESAERLAAEAAIPKPAAAAAPAASAQPVSDSSAAVPAAAVPAAAPAPAAMPAPAVPAASAAVPPVRAEQPHEVPAPAASAALAAAALECATEGRRPWGLAALGFALGAVLTGFTAFGWIAFGPMQREMEAVKAHAAAEIKKLQVELETERIEASNLRTGSRNLSVLLNAFTTDWDRPPEKSGYQKNADGVLIFWEDQMIWRKYYLYQGKGAQGPLTRYNPRPQKRGFVYLKNPTPGIWRFAVSALNKEGKETLKGEVLTVRFPLD